MKSTRILAIAAGAALTAPAFGQNLIPNGSFEDAGIGFEEFSDWGIFNNFFADGPADASNEVMAQDGVRCAKAFGFFSGGQNDHGAYQEFAINENTEYTLSGYGLTLAADAIEPFDPADPDMNGFWGNLILVVIDFKDGIGGNVISSGEINLFPAGSPTDTWNYAENTLVSPPGTAACQVTVLFIQFTDSPGSFFYDNISLVEGDPVTGGMGCNAADIDQDGDNDPDDIQLFVETFINGCG